MTISSEFALPNPPEDDEYLKSLVSALQSRHEEISQVTSTTFRNYADVDSSEWIPTLAASGGGTFTYISQIGWVLRQGIMNDVWFDISWSATTAIGNLSVELPYLATKSNSKPFVGVIQSSAISYGVGGSVLTINAIPNTYRGEIWISGSSLSEINLGVPASGKLIGHIRYIGVRDE